MTERKAKTKGKAEAGSLCDDRKKGKGKALLEEFYSDSPDRLKNAIYGLGLTVKKPSSDMEQD